MDNGSVMFQDDVGVLEVTVSWAVQGGRTSDMHMFQVRTCEAFDQPRQCRMLTV